MVPPVAEQPERSRQITTAPVANRASHNAIRRPYRQILDNLLESGAWRALVTSMAHAEEGGLGADAVATRTERFDPLEGTAPA